MTYDEALRLLGLEEGATEADIRLAYKEMAQILHPDKFASNKKLSQRANEQFKMVNEARDLLLSKKGSTRRGARRDGARTSSSSSGSSGSSRSSSNSSSSSHSSDSYYDRATSLRARLAGIAAAKTQLTAHLDLEYDRRRIAFYLLAGGIIGMIVGMRVRIIEPLGATALVWGAIQFFNTQSNIKKIMEHITGLEKDRKKCEKELAKLKV